MSAPLLLFIIAIVVFYLLTRNYNPNDYQHINLNQKQTLRGDLREHEAGLLVALMAKVAKADGKICELEAQLLSLTFTDIAKVFNEPEKIREDLKSIYNDEKKSFENTIIVAQKYHKLTKRDYTKRLKVLEYLLNLAFIDGEFSKNEFMITEDIANALDIKKSDFEQMITAFKQYYANRFQQQGIDLKKAYEILGLSEDTDFATVKKTYRKLVRENHPDILMGEGKEKSIIDEATEKLQEINEAYELIKKQKG